MISADIFGKTDMNKIPADIGQDIGDICPVSRGWFFQPWAVAWKQEIVVAHPNIVVKYKAMEFNVNQYGFDPLRSEIHCYYSTESSLTLLPFILPLILFFMKMAKDVKTD